MKARTAVAALALVGVVAAPAVAQRTASAQVDAPADGAVVSGEIGVRGSGEGVAGIKRIEILVDSWSVAVKEPDDFTRAARADYSWDTTLAVADGSAAPNGRHTVTVHVTTVDGNSDKDSIEVVANNPPQVPAGLSARSAQGRVEIAWEPNPEPDVLRYIVERNEGDGFVVVASTEARRLEQTLVPGDYSYRVTAVRASPVDDAGISSEPSDSVSIRVAASSAGGGSRAVTDLGGRNGLGAGRGLRRGGPSGLAALLSNSSLADQRGLPPIPSPPGIPWGSYEKQLPYGKAAVPPPGSAALASDRRSRAATLLPADGLRWVAAGLLLLACAELAVVTAARDAIASRARELES